MFIFACSLDQSAHTIASDQKMIFEEFLEAIGRFALMFTDRVAAQDNVLPSSPSSRRGRHLMAKTPGPWIGYNRAMNISVEERVVPMFNLVSHLRGSLQENREKIRVWRDRIAKLTARNFTRTMSLEAKRRASIKIVY